MCIPVHSPWLPGYINVVCKPFLLTMAGLFLWIIYTYEKHYTVYYGFGSPKLSSVHLVSISHGEQIPTTQIYKLSIYKPEGQYWLYYEWRSIIWPLLNISTATTLVQATTALQLNFCSNFLIGFLLLTPTIYLLIFYSLILERRGETHTHTSICCSTYLCIYWLILVCALTRDQTHNLGISGQCSKTTELPGQGPSQSILNKAFRGMF